MSHLQHEKYFKTTTPEKWTLKGFFEDYLLSSKSPKFQSIIDLYIRTLRDICNKPQEALESAQAASLLEAYRKGGDHALARNLWAVYERQNLMSASTVVNIGNLGVVYNQTDIGGTKRIDAPAEKKKRSKRPKRKRVESPPPPPPPPTYAEATESSADDLVLVGDSKRRKTAELSLLPKPLQEFHKEYLKMEPSRMWKLSNGTIVEETIYRAVMESSLPVPELQLLWAIDPKAPSVKAMFTPGELDEITMEETNRMRVLNAIAGSKVDCLISLSKYSEVETTQELREILFSPQSRIGIEEEWIEAVLKQMLVVYENRNNPLKSDQLENWYEMNLWSVLVDHLFMRSIHDVTLLRKEASSFATMEVLNQGRTATGPGNYMKTGTRSDLIIRGVGSDFPFEYGAGETAPKFSGETATKYIEDGMKLRITICHMLRRLVQTVKGDDASKLQVVGLQCAGLRACVLRIGIPKGYVGVVQQEEINGIPDDVRRLPKIAPLMRSLWRMKETVKVCLEVVSKA